MDGADDDPDDGLKNPPLLRDCNGLFLASLACTTTKMLVFRI